MKKVIVIGGATASGKTSLAIELALHFNTEIISADSRQCFKEMTIGTAVPSQEELKKVKHHFIHSHSIYDEMNAGVYEKYALEILNALFEKHDVVIIVGGTGLYIKALCEGIDEMPPVNKEIEKEVNEIYQSKGIVWLQETIKEKDPLFYHQGEMKNPHRMLRALTFYLTHQNSIYNFKTSQKKPRAFKASYYHLQIERDKLYQRINNRVDNMMHEGLLQEVIQLSDFEANKNLNTVGYSELFSHLRGELTLDQAIELIKQHTRNYAKRQLTWFKNQGEYIPIQGLQDIKS